MCLVSRVPSLGQLLWVSNASVVDGAGTTLEAVLVMMEGGRSPVSSVPVGMVRALETAVGRAVVWGMVIATLGTPGGGREGILVDRRC